MSDESSDESEDSESETETECDPAIHALTSAMAVDLHTWYDIRS